MRHDRESMIKALIVHDMEDPQYIEETLREGWRGYDNMTDKKIVYDFVSFVIQPERGQMIPLTLKGKDIDFVPEEPEFLFDWLE